MKTENTIKIKPNLRIFKGYPDMIPFISLFFILAVFFMLASNFVPVQGYQIDLPDSANAGTRYASRNLIVTISADGKIFFNDERQSDTSVLSQKIADYLKGNQKEADLLIRGDHAMKLETAVQLIAIAKKYNLKPYFIVDPIQETGKVNLKEVEQ